MGSADLKSRTNQILLHIICCAAFLSLPVLMPPSGSGGLRNILQNGHTVQDLLGYGVTLLFFYANYYYFIPQFYFRKRYGWFALFMVLSFALIIIIPNLIPLHQAPHAMVLDNKGLFTPPVDKRLPLQPYGLHLQELMDHVTHNILRFMVVFFISLLLKIRQQLKEVKKEKLNAELSYLKAQINPHFLFNTLNTIYSLSVEKSDQAPAAVVELSSMMRHVLDEANKDFVSLDKELNYIGNYIKLQQARFGKTADIVYSVSGSTAGKQIAPLLLIAFIENAFKHGINPEEDSEIDIRINITGNQLHLVVHNKKVFVQKVNEKKTGIGIVNTKNRLSMLYRGKHLLTINDHENDFSVNLVLELS